MNKKCILIYLHVVNNVQTERWTTNNKYIICTEVFSLYSFINAPACWNHEITSQTLRNKVTIKFNLPRKVNPVRIICYMKWIYIHVMKNKKSTSSVCSITIVLQFTLQVSIKEWTCKRNQNGLGSDLFWHIKWEANSSDVTFLDLALIRAPYIFQGSTQIS